MRWLLYLAAFLMLIFILLLGLPTAISSSAGQRWLLSTVSQRIDGHIEAKQISLGWLSGQRIEGLELKDSDGNVAFSVASMDTEAGLFSLITGAHRLGHTHIQSPFLRLVRDEQGRSNFDRIFGSEPASGKSSSKRSQQTEFQLPFVGQLSLSNGRVELEQAGLEAIALTDLELNLSVSQLSGPLDARMTALSRQGDMLGEVKLIGSMRGFDRKGRFLLQLDESAVPRLGEGAELSIQADIQKVPVAILDQILGQQLVSAALGDRLDLQIKTQISGPTCNIELAANSPNLAAKLTGATSGENFALTQAAQLRFTATPALFKSFAELAQIPDAPQLLAPTDLTAQIDRLHLPLQGATFSLSDASLQWTIQMGPATLRLPKSGEEQRIDTLSAEFDSSGLGKAVRIKAQANGGGSTLQIDGSFSDLMENGKRTLSRAAADLSAKVESFPIGLCDRLLGFDGLLERAVGGRLDANLLVQGKAGKLQATASATSAQLRIDRLSVEWDELIRLSSPASMLITLSPELVRQLDPGSSLLRPVSAQVELKALQVPFDLDEPLRFTPKETLVQAVIRAGDIDLTRASGEQITIERISAELSGEQLEGGQLSVALRADSRSLPGSAGLPADIELSGQLTWGSIGINNLAASIRSANSQLMAQGLLRTDQVLEITKPISLRHRLTPRHFPRLRDEAELQASIDPFKLPLKDLSLDQLQLQGTGQLASLVVEGGSLRDASLRWQLDFPAARASVDITATASSRDQSAESPLEAQVLAAKWWKDGSVDIKNAQVSTSAKLKALPIAIVEALSGLDGLVTLIGDSAEVNVESRLEQFSPPVGQADFHALGSGFAMSCAMDVDGKRLSTRDASTKLNWTLTPERFKILYDSGVSLRQDAEVELLIKQLSFPTEWNASQGPLRTVILDLSGSVRKLNAQESSSGQSLQVERLAVSASTRDMTDDVKFTLQGTGQGRSGAIGIDVNGRLGDLLSDAGEWNYARSSLALNAELKNVPPVLLGALAGFGSDYNSSLAALFGERLDSSIAVELSRGDGPVSCILDSVNSDARFKGRLLDGTLRLEETATASLFVTPELSRSVLKNVNPLLVTAVSAEEPIRVRLEPQGFSVQLLPFNIAKASFERGVIEIGKLRMRQGGLLGLFLGLTSLPGVGNQQEVNAWFTPQYMSLSNGVANIKRMDCLIAEQFHLATWGTVDIVNDRVDMTSGIGGATLRRNFLVRNVRDDFLMQTRITGTTGNASIPTARILAQIATMTGGGGGIGGILGNVIIGGAVAAAPEPTTQPFPWADFFPPPRQQEPAENVEPKTQEQPQQEQQDRRRPTLFDIIRPK